MLDKQSKRVLEAVNNHIDELLGTKCPLVLEKYLPQYTAEEIEKSLWYLDGLDYLSCFRAENTVWNISLTYEGEKYSEFSRLETMDFFKKSILTPIIVAMITSLFINFLTNYF